MTTTDEFGNPLGLTCNSFSSVSLDPPLVLWSLRLQSRSFAAFRDAPAFGINVLADDQKDLSARFASSKIEDRFAGVEWSTGDLGVPLIGACIARFECTRFATHLAGDHAIFIGKVERLDGPRQEDPLVFYKGAYMMIAQSLRELTTTGRLTSASLQEAISLVFGALVRLACQNGTDDDFDAIDALLCSMDSLTKPEDMSARNQAGMMYFRLIAKAAHNEVLEAVAESLNTILRQIFTADTTPRYRKELVPIRREILRLLRVRNAAGALAAMEGYFQVRLPQLRSLAGNGVACAA